MEALVARALLGNGSIQLSQLTGNESDAATPVLAVGRDADSGTRLGTFAESGFGVFTLPIQFQVDLNGGGSVTNLEYYPTETINGTFYDLGQGGYSSGGNVATALNAPGSQNVVNSGIGVSAGCWLIGYLGINDAANVNGGNNNLTYNGVAYSANGVAEGTYTFWTYEHLMYRTSLADGGGLFPKTIADQLASQIKNTDAVQSGLLLGSMKVSRTVEGGVITR